MTVDDDVAVELESVESRALHEEGALLGKECLERTQVEDGWVRFDLPEIRIHRGVERDVRGDAELEVAPDREALLPSVAAVRQRARDVMGEEIGGQFDRPSRTDLGEALELSEL